jgi:hypothetical protein
MEVFCSHGHLIAKHITQYSQLRWQKKSKMHTCTHYRCSFSSQVVIPCLGTARGVSRQQSVHDEVDNLASPSEKGMGDGGEVV